MTQKTELHFCSGGNL